MKIEVAMQEFPGTPLRGAVPPLHFGAMEDRNWPPIFKEQSFENKLKGPPPFPYSSKLVPGSALSI